MSQIELRPSFAPLADSLRARVREAVDFIGLKEAAWRCDVSPSRLSNALDERDRHKLLLEWLPAIITAAPNDAIVEELAAWRGLECVEQKPQTPAEELHALKGALAEMFSRDVLLAVTQRARRRVR